MLQKLHIKIDHKPDRPAANSKITEQLCFVDGKKRFDGLEFDQNAASNQYVGPIPTIQLDAFLFNWDRLLALKWNATKAQFSAKAQLVTRFKQARSEGAMHFHACSNHILSELVYSRP
jgi:hypothetical protein